MPLGDMGGPPPWQTHPTPPWRTHPPWHDGPSPPGPGRPYPPRDASPPVWFQISSGLIGIAMFAMLVGACFQVLVIDPKRKRARAALHAASNTETTPLLGTELPPPPYESGSIMHSPEPPSHHHDPTPPSHHHDPAPPSHHHDAPPPSHH